MKVSRVRLENFKRFKEVEISLVNDLTDNVCKQFLILGDNGSGKTTILQAIALCLAMVSGTVRQPADFSWQGWVPQRYGRWGKPVIELDIHFSQEEILATQEVAKAWYDNATSSDDKISFILPGDATELTVRLESGRYSVVGGNKENIFQFRGRKYAYDLLKFNANDRSWFSRLPGIFYFDQSRSLISQLKEFDNVEGFLRLLGEQTDRTQTLYSVGVSQLRRYLNNWQMVRLYKRGGHDWLSELEESYKSLFPERSFAPPEAMYSNTAAPEESYFMLSDGERSYDIEEMSGGEQVVFPILYEFVRMQIKNSIVLIDEIDLHLHPPLAQSLLFSLPAIGRNCQFILTTHSEVISSMVSSEETYRLPGEGLCL